MKNFFAVIGALCLIPLTFIYSSIAWGFVMFKFYYWFILPVFTGLPMITFTMAIGLSLFIDLFKNHELNNSKNNNEKWITIATSIVLPWIMILVALFIKWVFNF